MEPVYQERKKVKSRLIRGARGTESKAFFRSGTTNRGKGFNKGECVELSRAVVVERLGRNPYWKGEIRLLNRQKSRRIATMNMLSCSSLSRNDVSKPCSSLSSIQTLPAVA